MRVGCDIGGTFTDLVLADEAGVAAIHKVLTTPSAPALGALAGLREIAALAGSTLGAVVEVVHATTLVTNALIERRGARLALLTTRGFRDVLAMGSEQRYDIYDLRLRFPEPLVPRVWRREVGERTLASGQVERPVDPEEVCRVVAELVGQGVEAVAVCFLHSFRNPANEQAAKAAIVAAFPRLIVSCSHEVASEIREYERTVTTAANGYVQPLVSNYLADFRVRLAAAGFQGRMVLMQSSGGVASTEAMERLPVRLLESGPAAGALAAAWLGQRLGLTELISFDMGGTTAKACLIEGAAPVVVPAMEVARVQRFTSGSGLPVRTPTMDLIEIGAGGGSVARVNRLGLLKVGPDSAGADPGPACYGRGGAAPTVTDADLLLGYLNPGYFLGGRLSLQREAAARSLGELAAHLGLSLEETAWGIYDVVNEDMAAAVRVHVVERGRDVRRYAMLAFGGAGPVHAARVAQKLGVQAVLVPRVAGAFSALGLLVAPPTFEGAISRPVRLEEADWDEVEALFAEWEDRARAFLAGVGVPAEQVAFHRSAEMKFLGQMHEITVPLPEVRPGEDRSARLAAAFRSVYDTLFRHAPSGFDIQVLSWRLRAVGPAPEVTLRPAPNEGVDPLKGERPAYFAEAGGWISCPVLDRYSLAPGARWEGPCIVEEAESTTVVGPSQRLEVDGNRNLWIRLSSNGGETGE